MKRDKKETVLPDWTKEESWTRAEARQAVERQKEKELVAERTEPWWQLEAKAKKVAHAEVDPDEPSVKLSGLVNLIAESGWSTENIRGKVKVWLGKPVNYNWIYNHYRSLEGMAVLEEALVSLKVKNKDVSSIMNLFFEEYFGEVR